MAVGGGEDGRGGGGGGQEGGRRLFQAAAAAAAAALTSNMFPISIKACGIKAGGIKAAVEAILFPAHGGGRLSHVQLHTFILVWCSFV